MGRRDENGRYVCNVHPIALRARATGEVYAFWPDTGCPALLRAFAARRAAPAHPMSLALRATLQEDDADCMQNLLLVRCINGAISNYSGGGVSHSFSFPPDSPLVVREDTPIPACDALVLEALLVKKMLLDNPGVGVDEFLARDDFAFALYRFLDHLESLSENASVLNLVGMLKSDIDACRNIEYETPGCGAVWDVEETAARENPSSTPCSLDKVFSPGFYALDKDTGSGLKSATEL